MKRSIWNILFIALLAVAQSQSQTSTATLTLTPAKPSAVPNVVKFSGAARDINGKPLAGVVGATFSLYKDEQGGAALWMETQNVQADASGRYSVSLGANKPLPVELFSSSEARWLGVQIAGQLEGNRVLLLSVPYAMKAADAETVGGLPPSAFVLAVPLSGGNGSVTGASSSTATIAPALGGTGTTNFLPIWTNSTTLGNSTLFQTGTGGTAKVGIGTTTPSAALDVKGGATVRGNLQLPALGTATATAGFNSNPHDFVASTFNKTAAVNQTFRFQAEPAGNNTTTASGTMNLLYGAGTGVPAETGLKISNKGLLTFAAGQTFPGTGNGTITGITAGADLTGGGTTGNVTLNVDTTRVPLLASANTFAAGQSVNGNVTLSGSGNGVIFADGTKQTTAAKGGGTGTVTSVALTAPASDFTVTGTPITTSGTLGLGWTVAPTNAPTPNAIVKRDSGGSLSANSATVNSINATIPLFGGNGPAVQASSVAPAGVAVSATGGLVGVFGSTIGSGGSANGVQGASTNATAVRGDDAGSGSGVVGTSATGYGVYGTGAAGVVGFGSQGPGGLFSNHGPNAALLVQSDAFLVSDLLLRADSTFGGVTTPEMLLDVGGNLSIAGNISKAGGSFKIDHPLDPSNKYLYHSFVESPDMMNLYNGTVVLDAEGKASVVLPDWFEALNRDFRYQLTAIGAPGPNLYISQEVNGNRFEVAGGTPGGKVSWQVTGVRHDAWADAHRIPLEVDKTGVEKGKYLHPELFGMAPEKYGMPSKTSVKHPPAAARP